MIKGPFIFVAVVSIFLLVFLMNTSANWFEAQPKSPQFDVVAKYEGCDVVRFDNQMDARYHYFLHCK